MNLVYSVGTYLLTKIELVFMSRREPGSQSQGGLLWKEIYSEISLLF